MILHDNLPKGFRLAERYHVEERLGVGATSAVYRALDIRTETIVAVKVLDPLLASDPASVERFSKEVRILRDVTHPNVVRVHTLEHDRGLHFLSMELVPGSTLRSRLDRTGSFRAPDVVAFGTKLASALDACHRAGVVHRDIKPANVLVDGSMEPKVVDFGVAGVCTMSHLTRTGTYMGTPDYMAPEQFRRTTADPRSDVYSLGVVLYELLTGRLPHHQGSLARVDGGPPVEPPSAIASSCPAWLDAVVLKCLNATMEDRYQSAFELETDLKQGERSLAQYRRRASVLKCLNCGESMLEGLSFCHHCGSFVVDHFERGKHAVILYRCDDPEDFSQRLSSVGVKSRPALDEQLRKGLPRVLVGGLAEDTAHIVTSELFGGRAELSVSARLPSEMRLPHRYLVYALTALGLVLAVGNPEHVASILVGVAASCGVVVTLYRARVRPLVPMSDLPSGGGKRISSNARVLAPRIGRLRRRETKVLLGTILRNFETLSQPLQTESLQILLGRAVDAGETMDRCELSLSGQSLVELLERREALVHRLESSPGARESEDLIEQKAVADREIRAYQEARDLHARLHLALIDLNRSLSSIALSTEALPFDTTQLDVDVAVTT